MYYSNIYRDMIVPFNHTQAATYIVHVDKLSGACAITPVNTNHFRVNNDIEENNFKLQIESTIIGETRYLHNIDMNSISYDEILDLIKEVKHE